METSICALGVQPLLLWHRNLLPLQWEQYESTQRRNLGRDDTQKDANDTQTSRETIIILTAWAALWVAKYISVMLSTSGMAPFITLTLTIGHAVIQDLWCMEQPMCGWFTSKGSR